MRFLLLSLFVLALAACQSDADSAASTADPAAEVAPPTSCEDGEVTIEDLEEGTGAAATPTSVVVMNYEGRLQDGTVFDANDGFPMPLTQVVDGFRDGVGGNATLPPMKEGGHRLITLPPNLAYGAAGRPPRIPACATLVFDVEALEVQS